MVCKISKILKFWECEWHTIVTMTATANTRCDHCSGVAQGYHRGGWERVRLQPLALSGQEPDCGEAATCDFGLGSLRPHPGDCDVPRCLGKRSAAVSLQDILSNQFCAWLLTLLVLVLAVGDSKLPLWIQSHW